MAWLQEGTIENLKVLVLGSYGTGKSFFAKSFPEPIYLLDFDKGAISYQGRKVYVPDYLTQNLPIQQKFMSMEKDIDLLIQNQHPEGQFSTIVLDSLTTFLKEAMELALATKRSPDGLPQWNVHYAMVKVYTDRLIERLRRFQGHICVICHLEYIRNEMTGEILAVPSVTGNLKTYIPALFDEVYFTEIATRGGKVEYTINLAPKGFMRARSRLRAVYPEIPDTLPNSFDSIQQYIKNKKEVKAS